jgi:hypothetical protein
MELWAGGDAYSLNGLGERMRPTNKLMHAAPFLTLLLLSHIALADDQFSARVEKAKAVKATPEGQRYEKALEEQVGVFASSIVQRCFPRDSKADTASFTLVGNVLPNRTLSRMEIRPVTKMSECFASGFVNSPFPQPPDSFGADGIPIEINMQITPP